MPIPDILKVPRTDPVYNCHGYLTKVPIKAILPFIEHYSMPGETIADFFAGSGMSGIAAAILGRNALLSDISALGQHINQGYLSEVDSQELMIAADNIVALVRENAGLYYQTIRSEDGNNVELIRTIWSFVYVCPQCNQEFVFFNYINIPEENRNDACSNCGAKFIRRTWAVNHDIPVKVVIKGVDGKQVEQEIQNIDTDNIAQAERDIRLQHVPSLPIDPDREMYSRSGLGKRGLTETKYFFSARNAIILKELWEAISDINDIGIRKKLQFAFTAILPRASRRYQWSKKRPLNAQNQTYYISPVYYEWNVFELFLRKVKATTRSDDVIFGKNNLFGERTELGNVIYNLASADSLDHIVSESVNYVFTDPPFGSNIFYSDMSLFHEAWLGQITNNDNEAVIHTCGAKKINSIERYKELLKSAFREAYRILIPGGYMSVVFGNSNGSIWSLVLKALREAGFDSIPDRVTILDKGQRSVKGLSSGSESVVTVDLILTVQKPIDRNPGETNGAWRQAEPEDLTQTVIANIDNGDLKNPSYVYAQILREAINQHLLVDNLHLSDVLIALRNAGFSIDSKKGHLIPPSN